MSKLGAHIVSGSRNGYGPMCQAKPAVVLAHGEGGALVEAKQKSGGHTHTIYRHTLYKDAPQGIDQWTPTQAIAAAATYYPQLRAQWVMNPADYYLVVNEPAGNDVAIMPTYIAYEQRVMELAAADGYKICALNLAGGTPGDLNVWKSMYVPHIRQVFEAGGVYGRHAYGGEKLSVPNGNTNRPFLEADHLRSVGLGYGGIVITEAGQNGGFGFIGTEAFMADTTAYNTQMMAHSNIIGACLWTLGDWEQHNSNWQDATPAMTNWMLANPTPKWVPGTPPPPPSLPKIVVVKKPQGTEITAAENAAANQYAWDNYKRTTTHSVDDMMRLLTGGNDESYAVLAYPDRPSQTEAMDALLEAGIDWVNWPSAPTNPLIGLRLGHVLPYRYVLTSPFNAIRDYGKHEGADYDLVGGVVDNKVNVLCAYPGVVDRSLDTTGGYGKYVRVMHIRNGSVFYTRYAHLDSRLVTVGQSLSAGDPIGEIGNTGNSTGEHVHLNLEVPGYGLHGYVVDWVVDPEPYMALGRESLPLVPVAAAVDLRRFIMADPTCWRVVRSPNGGQEDVQDMLLKGGLFVRRKNALAEWWKSDTQFYYLVHDTSPAPDSQGNERVYTLSKNAVAGAPMMPLSLAVNQSWQESGTHNVQFRAKSDCRLLSENSGAAQNAAALVRYEKNFTFNRYGQNLIFDEVIWLKHKTETQIYARKDGKPCGWIGWSAPWGESETVELYWDRPPMMQEPNRFCSW